MKVKREHYELPDDQCERLTGNEMDGLRWCLNTTSMLFVAKDNLQKRLECVPYGRERMNMLTGGMNALFQDLLGTVTNKQRKALRNTARDYKIKLVPAVGMEKSIMAVDEQDFKTLISAAKNKCKDCTKCGMVVRKCPLYQILEVYVPLDEYDDTIMCSYAYKKWEEDDD